MRAVGWHGFECFGDDTLNLLIGDLAGSADWKWLIQQAINPNSLNRSAPLSDGRAGDMQFPRDLRVVLLPSPQLST